MSPNVNTMSSERSAETERVRRVQDKHAPGYDRQMGFFDQVLFAGGREWACSQATREVLEIAVGTGRNLAHYGPEVKLAAIEFSPEMLAIAKRRADELGAAVDLRLGDAQALEFEDESRPQVRILLGAPQEIGCQDAAADTKSYREVTMSKKSEEFSLDVPVDKAASACKQAIEDLGWKAGDVESNRIVAKVGFGAIRNPAQHEIVLSEAGNGTGVTLNSKILQVGPIAKKKLNKQADELKDAIRAAV